MRRTELPSRLAAALSRWSLVQHLTLLVLVTALPLLLSSLFMYNRLVANERDSLRQGLFVSAKTLAGLVDNEIETHAAIASTLSQSASLQRNDLLAFWQEAKRALEFVPGAWLAVSTPDGQIVLNTLSPPGTTLPKHVAPDVIQRAFAERRAQVADMVFGPVSQRWTSFVEVPVFRDREPLYSISVALTPDRILALMTSQFTRGEVVAIVDRNKKFVARIPDQETRVGTLSSEGWRAAMARSPNGWAENKTVEGEWSLTGYAQTVHGWTVGVAALESDIARPLSTILWTSAFVAGVLTLMGLALAVSIGRHMSSGMTELATAARDLGEGRLVRAPSAPFAEASTIATALAEVSVELERRDGLIARNQVELEAKVVQRTDLLVAEIKRREATETTLRQAQKMDSIGQLTGGIAHDFNNMLTVILGNLDTVQRRLKSLDNAAVLTRPVEAAVQGARNAAKLTHRLLAFARQQPLEPSTLDLNAQVAGLADLVTRTVGEDIEVETVAGAGLWRTFADANQLENCLINLVINARHAMTRGGRLTIETANTYLDEAYVARFGDLIAGQYVMLSVSDTGTGIPPETLEKVFEPFFTTKEVGKGTGLGLAMVHGFVRQSGGHIRIYSEVGEGTTVKIYLPRHTQESPINAIPVGETVDAQFVSRASIGETILLVEDDPSVREYAIAALEDLGYQVLAAADGKEAIHIFTNATRVDALFTDVVLQGDMTGRQVAEQLLRHKPSLPVLFTTGYTRNAIVHQGRLDPGVNLLSKPYTQRDLAKKIRHVIDSLSKNAATAAS